MPLDNMQELLYGDSVLPASTVQQLQRLMPPTAPVVSANPSGSSPESVQNIGEVGNPTPQQLAPQPPMLNQVPMGGGGPLGEDVTQQVLGGGNPSPSPMPPAARPQQAGPVPTAPVAASAASPAVPPRYDHRAQQKAVGTALVRFGTPAQRVQGMQMIWDADQPSEEERYNRDLQRKRSEGEYDYALGEKRKEEALTKQQTREIGYADALGLDPQTRAKADYAVRTGAKPEQLYDITGISLGAQKADMEKRQAQTKWGTKISSDAQDLGVLETAAERADKLITKGTATTGFPASIAQHIPNSQANQLLQALEPMQRIIGFNRLQEMREASKTGGALGNVSDTEGRWLASVQGSLDPVQAETGQLRENIKSIVEGKRILNQMHMLIPGMDAQDPDAWAKYAELTQQLGKVGETVRTRMQAEEKANRKGAPGRQDTQPPKPGARKAPDGNWYVERP